MRRALDRLFALVSGLAAAAACTALLGIVSFILARGLPVLSWSFLSRVSEGAGAGGGILYQLLGTLLLVVTALAVATPSAVALALWRTVYATKAAARRRLDLVMLTVNGVPSILLGVFGLLLFSRVLGWGKSWLAGGVVLGLMILPTMTVALVERIQAIPERYLSAAVGLGLGTSQIVRSVILPMSFGGLVSGALLGLARAAGETAPIMFTAVVFSGAGLPLGIVESPVLALPYHIFVLAQDFLDPEATGKLWGAAFVLLALVFSLSLLALPLRLRAHQGARDA